MGIRRSLTASAFAAAALLAAATTAAADTAPNQPRPPRANLQLTITADVVITGVTLTCEPSGGNHSNSTRACNDLRRARGDLDRLPGQPQVCTMEYRPVTATAHGHWRGKPVTWQRMFGNRCELDAATSWVFRF